MRLFYCSSDGSKQRNLQAVKIHFRILFMWQEINQGKCETHILLFTAVSYETRKHVSDLSMFVFCFGGRKE